MNTNRLALWSCFKQGILERDPAVGVRVRPSMYSMALKVEVQIGGGLGVHGPGLADTGALAPPASLILD